MTLPGRIVSAVFVLTKLTIQVAGIVAGPVEPALSRFREQLLALTVLLGLVVLLAILDESSPATRCPTRPIFLEPVFARDFG